MNLENLLKSTAIANKSYSQCGAYSRAALIIKFVEKMQHLTEGGAN